jgi:hypothetical protein
MRRIFIFTFSFGNGRRKRLFPRKILARRRIYQFGRLRYNGNNGAESNKMTII